MLISLDVCAFCSLTGRRTRSPRTSGAPSASPPSRRSPRLPPKNNHNNNNSLHHQSISPAPSLQRLYRLSRTPISTAPFLCFVSTYRLHPLPPFPAPPCLFRSILQRVCMCMVANLIFVLPPPEIIRNNDDVDDVFGACCVVCLSAYFYRTCVPGLRIPSPSPSLLI